MNTKRSNSCEVLRVHPWSSVFICGLHFCAVAALALLATRGAANACVGTNCLEIFSTEQNGGALTIYWDFANKKVQTFRTALCTPAECLYSAIDPGFITSGDPPPDGYFRLADGTNVTLEIVSMPQEMTVRVDGQPLKDAHDTAALGTAPTLHTHPSWQLTVPESVRGDYELAFKLTTDSPLYGTSADFHLLVTNLPTPTPSAPTASATPTPTQTSAPILCPGDCDGDGTVAINELVGGVTGALGNGVACRAFDLNSDGIISISELVAAVNSALIGCAATPTPTATQSVTLGEIQRNIFSPKCAIPTCHNAGSKAGSLNLSAGSAYDQLVGVDPKVDTAREAGMLRVDPGNPDNSFLIVKLDGPPPDQGSRMPLTGQPLSQTEIARIRAWIAQGAQP